MFWILVVTFRNSVSIWAADELTASHRVPNSFVGIDRWSGMNFQLYTAMGHAAQAVVGVGLIAFYALSAMLTLFLTFELVAHFLAPTPVVR